MIARKSLRKKALTLGTAGAVLASVAAGWSATKPGFADGNLPGTPVEQNLSWDGLQLAAAGRPSFGAARQRTLDAMRRSSPAATPNTPATPPAAGQIAVPPPAPATSATEGAPQRRTVNGKSDVERQLEELYRRDGREMPEMNFAPAAPRLRQPGATAQQPMSRQQAAPESAKSGNAITNFFRKLLPNKDDTPTPMTAPAGPGNAADVATSAPRLLPAEQRNLAVPAPLPAVPAAVPAAAPVVAEQKPINMPLPDWARDDNDDAESLDLDEAKPTAKVEVALDPAPKAETPIVPAQAEPAVDSNANVAMEVANENEFPDPFTDVSEQEADATKSTPFSGLKLEPQTTAANMTQPLPLDGETLPVSPENAPEVEVAGKSLPLETDAATEIGQPRLEVTFEATTESVVEAAPEAPAPALPGPALPVPAEQPIVASEPADKRTVEQPRLAAPSSPTEIATTQPQFPEEPQVAAAQDDPYAEEMRQIRMRGEIPGFKGFCPVTLREQRQLVDASPRYLSRYVGVTYTFASSDAKAEFDRDPARYAPAAAGHDVVLLLNGQDDVEGSLDHAVWYRDQLYMFSSERSYQTFVNSPLTYAAPRVLP